MERTVTAALEKWREEVWEAEWADGNVSITFIMTDKVLQAVARAAETVQTVKDLRETTPPFGLWKRYGSSILDIIRESRQQVYSRYQAMQAESLQRQIKTAEECEAQKEAGRQKVERSRLRKNMKVH